MIRLTSMMRHLILLSAALQAASAAPLSEQIEVFRSGTGGINRYRIPGIVVTTKGTVLAYCEARRNDSADMGEIEVHLRQSPAPTPTSRCSAVSDDDGREEDAQTRKERNEPD